jgi:AraC-like DNA-binding protein
LLTIQNVYRDDYILDWHNRLEHVHFHVFVAVTEGRLLYTLNNRSLSAKRGDVLLIPIGTERQACNAPDTLHQKYAVTFRCTNKLTEELPILSSPEPVLLHSRAFEYYREKFQFLHRQSMEKRPYHSLVQEGALLEMLSLFNRDTEAPFLPNRKQQMAAVLEQYILNHYREPILLQQLGERIGRSPNYTLTLFKEATGMTPVQYQNRLKITSAIEMMQNTQLTIAYISDYLGFYDASSFYKAFKRITGCSPTGYSKR